MDCSRDTSIFRAIERISSIVAKWFIDSYAVSNMLFNLDILLYKLRM